MSEPAIIVVGGGVMGLATARAAARAGMHVHVFEAASIGHTAGSSHGAVRIFRLAYPDPAFVRLGMEARALWSVAEAESGRTLIEPRPAVSVTDDVEGLATSMADGGAPFAIRTARDARAAVPGLLVDGDVIIEEGAGVIRAAAVLEAFGDEVRARGSTIATGRRIRAIEPAGEAVRVVTPDGGTQTAPVVVVTAGGWAKDLLAAAGIGLDVWPQRETIGYFRCSGPAPVVLEWTMPLRYALPAPGGLVKAALHIAGARIAPDVPAEPDPDLADAAGSWIAGRIEGVDPRPVSTETCPYTMTADESFVLERHGRIVVGSACSGHGFKFAPAIGDRLVALAADVL